MSIHYRGVLQQIEDFVAKRTADDGDWLEFRRLQTRLYLMIQLIEAGESRFDWERCYRLGLTSPYMHETLFPEELGGFDPAKWDEKPAV